ncbi:MAG: flagellar brake domain-containing protein [bacterium]
MSIHDYIKELTKFELEFIDKNGNYHVLKSYIKSIDQDKILIFPPSHKNVTYNIPDSELINIIICTEDGVYSGESKVIGKELSHTPGLWISYPYNSQLIQRREYVRVPLRINIDLIISENNTSETEIKIMPENISGKGFCYISDSPLNNYYDIKCKIYLKDEPNKPIISRCEHIYTNPINIGGKSKYINAFAFIDINLKDVDRIVKACFKYQFEQRKKGLL